MGVVQDPGKRPRQCAGRADDGGHPNGPALSPAAESTARGGRPRGPSPHGDRAGLQVLSLPMHSYMGYMGAEDQVLIAEEIAGAICLA
jgi:hypothetical protein